MVSLWRLNLPCFCYPWNLYQRRPNFVENAGYRWLVKCKILVVSGMVLIHLVDRWRLSRRRVTHCEQTGLTPANINSLVLNLKPKIFIQNRYKSSVGPMNYFIYTTKEGAKNNLMLTLCKRARFKIVFKKLWTFYFYDDDEMIILRSWWRCEWVFTFLYIDGVVWIWKKVDFN